MFPNKLAEIRKSISKLFSGATIENGEDPIVAMYKAQEAYYKQNGLYDSVMSAAYYLDTWHESMKPIRNPANRSVEFFVNKIMPGILPDSLPIITSNDKIIDPIHNIWNWSNLNGNKSKLMRWFSIYGDLFIRPDVTEDGSKVYLKFLKPHVMTDWSVDDRGYLTSLRIDVPINKNLMHTEYWTNVDFEIWEHNRSKDTPLLELGAPILYGVNVDYGIDFVPFVHIKFRDVGDKRGWGAFTHCLDKIDEANRMATRLHEMLFRYNKPFWAVMANALSADGSPIPAPLIKSKDKNGSRATDDSGDTNMSDNDLFRLPGTSSIESLVPDLNYGEALLILQDMMTELEKDLPELTYYELSDTQLSGIAMSHVLGGAVARTEEARTNWEQGLARAENMALTMGVYHGIFSNIGNYDRGEFEHSYTVREVFPSTIKEKAETMKALVDAGVDSMAAAKLAGFNEDDIGIQISTEASMNDEVKALLRAQLQKVLNNGTTQ